MSSCRKSFLVPCCQVCDSQAMQEFLSGSTTEAVAKIAFLDPATYSIPLGCSGLFGLNSRNWLFDLKKGPMLWFFQGWVSLAGFACWFQFQVDLLLVSFVSTLRTCAPFSAGLDETTGLGPDLKGNP